MADALELVALAPPENLAPESHRQWFSSSWPTAGRDEPWAARCSHAPTCAEAHAARVPADIGLFELTLTTGAQTVSLMRICAVSRSAEPAHVAEGLARRRARRHAIRVRRDSSRAMHHEA
jgi:hypothetical protein